VIKIRLACPSILPFCQGKVKLRTRTRLRGRRRTLGTKAFKIPGGTSRLTRIRLTRRLGRLVRHSHHRTLRLKASVVARHPRGVAHSSRITLVLHAKRRNHHRRGKRHPG
jgi:hypothetical protein